MRRILCTTLLFFSTFALTAQTPTRLFDIRAGDGAVHSGNTYSHATLIVYRDNASKQAIFDAFASAYGYQDTINGQPNPQSKRQFFSARITDHIREVYRAQKIKEAAEAAAKTAKDAADGELPEGIIRP